MGNCQAIDAAVLVIQHPSGREERLYWPVTAREVMKMNPGHYVSLIIPLPPVAQDLTNNPQVDDDEDDHRKSLLVTRVKLLRSTDTLVLGRAYRLITSQEVMKVLRAKKYAKMKKNQPERVENLSTVAAATEKPPPPPPPPEKLSPGTEMKARTSELEKAHQEMKRERHRQRTMAINSATARLKSWRPSLQSISEAGS